MGGHWKGCEQASKYRIEVIKEAERDVEVRNLKVKKKWAYDLIIRDGMAKKNKELNEEYVEVSMTALDIDRR